MYYYYYLLVKVPFGIQCGLFGLKWSPYASLFRVCSEIYVERVLGAAEPELGDDSSNASTAYKERLPGKASQHQRPAKESGNGAHSRLRNWQMQQGVSPDVVRSASTEELRSLLHVLLDAEVATRGVHESKGQWQMQQGVSADAMRTASTDELRTLLHILSSRR